MKKYGKALQTPEAAEMEARRLAEKRDKQREGLGAQDEKFFSNKKNVLRLIFFIIAVVVAVGSITYGVYLLIHKDPGWFTIEADTNEETPYYAAGITFNYALEGSSTEIGVQMKEIKSIYQSALNWNYKILDAHNTYNGLENIASINKKVGQDVEIGEELFDVLTYAATLSRDGAGYDVCGGVFNAIRDEIVYSEDPAARDPLFNSDYADLLKKLDSAAEAEKPATLTLDPKRMTARLDVSADMRDFIDKYEIDAPVLDLGTLRTAFLLRALAVEMKIHGYTRGYFTTDSGLTLLLPDVPDTEFCMYSRFDGDDGEESDVAVTRKSRSGSACAAFRAFGFFDGEYGFYNVKNGDKTAFRNPYMDSFDNNTVFSVMVVDDDGDIVKAAARALAIFNAESKEDVHEFFDPIKPTIFFELTDARGTVNGNTETDITVNFPRVKKYTEFVG